jgi:hypothetical protein
MTAVPTALVADACFLLNLLATERDAEIVRSLGLRLLSTPQAGAEVRYLAGPRDERGRPTRIPTDVRALVERGDLELVAVPGEAADVFVLCATQLRRDADSTSLALAAHGRLPLATDDRRIREVARAQFPTLELHTTLGVLRRFVEAARLTEAEAGHLAVAVATGGNFLPPRDDPDAAWYRGLLERWGQPPGY